MNSYLNASQILGHKIIQCVKLGIPLFIYLHLNNGNMLGNLLIPVCFYHKVSHQILIYI